MSSSSTPPAGSGSSVAAPSSRRTWLAAAAVAIGAIVVLAGIAWYLLFGGEAPAAVDIDAAAGAAGATPAASVPASEATPSSTTPPGSTKPETTPAAAGIDGTWTVDTATGSFSDFTSTWVGFRVNEVLAQGIGGVEAVGRTPDVSGSLELEGTTLVTASIEADLTGIESDRPRRDGAIQRALETSSFPTATFVLTQPVDLGAVPETGQTVQTTATGDLTIHGTTRPVGVALQARLVDDTIVVVGSTGIVFSDFGVSMPRAPIVVSVEDQGIIELQLFFRRPPG